MGNSSRRPSFAYCRSAAAIRSPIVESDDITTWTGQLPLPVLLFVSSPMSLGSGEEALWFPATGSCHTQNGGRVQGQKCDGGSGQGGVGWGNTRPRPGFFKPFPNPPQTRLIKFNPVPLGAGRGGYPKKPAPLPSLIQTTGLGPGDPIESPGFSENFEEK